MTQSDAYLSLNAKTRFRDRTGNYHFTSDKEAVEQYMIEHVEPNTMVFTSLIEKLDYLVSNN
ncbi:hypothetical protein HK178_11785, partial [Streptococcus agalactiae]|nr:hypothetical protein [Streptococcus agalactiae]MCK6334704.1 hypothetical protein [Streptococcus agalactiae]